jgi:hypothetical protein
MGGNLLKHWNLPEKRIPTIEYNRIMNELLDKLRRDYTINRPVQSNYCWVVVAPSIRDKETHGDLDILIGRYNEDIQMKWKDETDFGIYIEKEFGYKPFVNSNVYSFPYDGFQVDVTFHPVNTLSMAVNYSSWGDLGNIMGRVFHKMGLHYGHAGLSFWIRQGLFDDNTQWSDNDHVYEKVVLTTDMQEICELGGFDYDRWSRGFDTEQDAFNFVVDSKYFHPDLFQLENLNHANRVRNRKRGMYMRFVEYVNNSYWKPQTNNFRSKEEYSLLMQLKYKHLNEYINRYRLVYEVNKIVQTKVNGKLVMEWLDLTQEKDGKLIGQIMSRVKELGSYKLLEMSQDKIIEFVQSWFKVLGNNVK